MIIMTMKMKKAVDHVVGAVALAVVAIHLHLKERMPVRLSEFITVVHLMMEHNLIHHMTAMNH